jgi:feruloyl esterase
LYAAVQREALRQCDAIDGAADGVIQEPEFCRFRPEELLCRSGRQAECLTPEQVNTLHLWYGHSHDSKYPMFFHSLTPGSEASWEGLVPETEPSILGINAIKSCHLQDPDWRWQDFAYEEGRDAAALAWAGRHQRALAV